MGYGVLYKDLQSWWARINGKEDPNSKIDEANQIRKKFYALEDMSFELKEGDILGVIGRNGAGKTTLLKILSRITTPTKGTVYIKGRINSLLEVGTGFHQELTGRENIYLNGAIHGMSKREIDKKLQQIWEFSDIGDFLDTPVKRYSSGMYVRLGFSVAAYLESDILIVDEVLAVGDAKFQKKCIGKMEEVGKSGRTVIFVSHNTQTISRLCNRGILLEKGRLIRCGNIKEVVDSYTEAGVSTNSLYINDSDDNKDITITRIEVTGASGQLLNEVPYNELFDINVYYNVNRVVKNTKLTLRIETLDLFRVLESCDFDNDRSLLGKKDEGGYQATVRIPGKFLSPGMYKLTIESYNHDKQVLYENISNLTIMVTETGCIDLDVFGRNNRTGVVQPILHWETKKI